MPKILCVVGTRPEGTKMAPVVQELRKYCQSAETILVSTGQHQEMLSQALKPFDLEPDIDLKVMHHGQSLASLTSKIVSGLEDVFKLEKPDFVVGQGDTTTCFASSLTAFYHQIKFAHVEAGLRTESIWLPFPEEFNRRAVGLTASLHFAPTNLARENLLKEKVNAESIYVTGNTSIDAVLSLAGLSLKDEFQLPKNKKRILVTTHRRENWGQPQARIARATRRIIESCQDTVAYVAMHRNPMVRQTLLAELDGIDRIKLMEPPNYEEFVPLMKASDLILTDSGGIQEEAPALKIPVLILRSETERPEGVYAGCSKLVGTNEDLIFQQAVELLESDEKRAKMTENPNPYGDGKASERIRFELFKSMGISSQNVNP